MLLEVKQHRRTFGMTNVRPVTILSAFEKGAYSVACLAVAHRCGLALLASTPHLSGIDQIVAILVLMGGVALWGYLSLRIWKTER